MRNSQKVRAKQSDFPPNSTKNEGNFAILSEFRSFFVEFKPNFKTRTIGY